MKNIAKLQDIWRPRTNTGKTKYNREKSRGESWVDRRAADRGADYVCKEKWVL